MDRDGRRNKRKQGGGTRKAGIDIEGGIAKAERGNESRKLDRENGRRMDGNQENPRPDRRKENGREERKYGGLGK